jgi:hypothetical protein
MTEQEFIVSLDHCERSDGSVMITSGDLPLFSVVGKNASEALTLVLELLPEYLTANVPEFVKLRQASSIDSVMLNKGSPSVPKYMIAELEGGALDKQQRELAPA